MHFKVLTILDLYLIFPLTLSWLSKLHLKTEILLTQHVTTNDKYFVYIKLQILQQSTSVYYKCMEDYHYSISVVSTTRKKSMAITVIAM